METNLDGITLLRYAHIARNRSSGGVEQYLCRLNHELLHRYRMTIIQMHLVRDEKENSVEVEAVGRGRILWVPVHYQRMDRTISGFLERLRYLVRRSDQFSEHHGRQGLSRVISSIRAVLNHQGKHFRYSAIVFSEMLCHILITHKVDLLVLHWLSYDTPALVLQARKVGVPSVFINHFDNARLAAPGRQRSLAHVSGIGTVSEQGIPAELRNLCVNLSDAVDTEFFNPEKARPLPRTMSPIVLLPARIEIGKGHIDLVKAASILIARKVDLLLCFAGAIDSEPLHQELCSFIATTGLVKRVIFIGEKSLEEIRDWYAMSAVVVLPSHSEGLSRVLIEAQAMKKPVVAYDIAGTREAVLPGETGFLVEPGNTEALADKIHCLLDNESERLRIGELGRKFVSRQFGLSALVARHESFYLNALSTQTLSPLGTYSNLDNIQGR